MDYKLIIILLVLFISMIVIYREITNLKEEMVVHLDNMTIDAESYSKNLTNNMNGIMTKYIDKIKNISVENIDQIKKINIINNQPILTNKYTDTDDSDIRTDNIHMSDSKKDQVEYNIFHTKNKTKQEDNSHYYMSDESYNNTDKSCEYKCIEQQNNTKEENNSLTNVDDVIFPKYNGEKEEIQIDDNHTSIYEDTTVNEKVEDVKEEGDENEDEIVINATSPIENEDITNFNIKNLKQSFSEHIENNNEFVENVDKLDIDNESSIFIEDEDSYISFVNSQNTEDKKEEKESEKQEEVNVDTESSHEINIDVNNIISKTKVFNEISTDNTVVMDKITNKKNITVFTNIDSESTYDSQEANSLEQEIQSYMSSAYTGNITINKNDSKAPVFKKQTLVDTDDSIYKNLTIENLQPMSNYKLESLKKITKHLSLPLSIVKHNKRRNYKKDELYKNIKKCLKTKKENPTSK